MLFQAFQSVSVTDLKNTVVQKKAAVPLFISGGAAPLVLFSPKDVKSLAQDFVVTYRRSLVCKPVIIWQFFALYINVAPRVFVTPQRGAGNLNAAQLVH